MKIPYLAALVAPVALACCPTVAAQSAAPVAKAYVIAEIVVKNPVAYETYKAAIGALVRKFKGTYLVRGGDVAEVVDGPPPQGRVVVIEFPSLAAAEAFEHAPETLEASKIRHSSAVSRLYVVEGAKP
ncbi:MAG: DUF1330 domain-containing protein [Sphingomicrobium sp.]|nr:DUF1330 domain-containing protein [Sphingomonadales bacterium]